MPHFRANFAKSAHENILTSSHEGQIWGFFIDIGSILCELRGQKVKKFGDERSSGRQGQQGVR